MIKKVLPVAVAIWPMLNEIDAYQPIDIRGHRSDAIKRRYIVNLKFNDDHHRDVDAWLRTCLTSFGLEDGKLPWKKDKKTGQLLLMATSREDYRPISVDAAKNEVPPSVRVGNGSRLKVYVTVNPYTGFGGGITLIINSYQILELKPGGEDPFEKEDGYTVAFG